MKPSPSRALLTVLIGLAATTFACSGSVTGDSDAAGGEGGSSEGGRGGGNTGMGGKAGGAGGAAGSAGGGAGMGGAGGATTPDASVPTDGGADAGGDAAPPPVPLDPQLDHTLAYDGLNGAGNLHGLATGVGWLGTWSKQGASSDDQTLAAESLLYPGLATLGGSVTGRGYSTAGRFLATMDNGPFRDSLVTVDGNTHIGGAGKVVWASFVIQKNSDDDSELSLLLSRSGVDWAPEARAPVRVGFFGDASKQDGKRFWSLRTVDDAGTGPSAVAMSGKEIEIGKPALVVLKLEFGASTNTVSMFVNPPTLMGPAPAAADATASTMGTLAFRGVVFIPGNSSIPNHAAVDELRFGRTYASVTPRSGVTPYWAPAPQVTTPANSNVICNRVRIFGQPGFGQRLLQAKIKGSNSGETTNFEDIGTISYLPAEGAWTEYAFSNTKSFRYIKLVSAPNGYVSAADVEFYGGTTRLTGRAFGSAGSLMDSGNTYDKALDGNTSTVFVAPTPSDAYVGYDLGTAETQVASPTFTPEAAPLTEDAVMITIATTTAGATIKCTTDGSWPSPTNGFECAGTRTFTKAQTPGGRGKLALRAIAYKTGLFDSVVTAGNYYLNFSGVDVTSFHLGNSLTDTLNAHLGPISAATGKDHTYHRCTIPGAPTDFIWQNGNGGCLGVGSWPTVYENPARYGQLTHQSTQPFSGHGRSGENESLHTLNFLDAARAGGSPNVQHWLYGQWPDRDFSDNFSRARSTLATGDAYPYAQADVNSFEKAALNHMAYFRSLKAAVDAGIAANAAKYGSKPVKIIPGPLAMYALTKEIYAGDGSAMLTANYEDGLHLTGRGAYYISLLTYSALFNESPEGKENSHYLTVGLTLEQATALQKLAWEVWSAFEADATYWPNAKP